MDLEALAHGAAGRLAHRVDGVVDHLRQPEAAAKRFAAPSRAARLRGPRRRVVGQAEQHPDQGDPVGDAMVDPHHKRAAATVVLDVLELPQWLREVEGRAHDRADHFLELLLAPGIGQRRPLQVRFEVEVLVVHPPWGEAGNRRLYHFLPESVEGQQPVLDELLELRELELLVKGHHPGDEHQVSGGFHAQPRRIDVRHRLALEQSHLVLPPRRFWLHFSRVVRIVASGAGGIICEVTGLPVSMHDSGSSASDREHNSE